MSRWVAASVLFSASILLAVGQASAHKVSIYAYEEGGKIHTESYFVDGTPARDSHVTAYDGRGKPVADGRTDDDGIFVFPLEHPGDLRIVLEASMGHRNEIMLPASDTADSGAGQVPEKSATVPESPTDSADGLQRPSLEKAVSRVLDARLGPIHDSIMKIQQAMEKPSMAQVLGGLGYIIGLAGAFLWGMSRKKSD